MLARMLASFWPASHTKCFFLLIFINLSTFIDFSTQLQLLLMDSFQPIIVTVVSVHIRANFCHLIDLIVLVEASTVNEDKS
jgi:hypothetical protein